ncbi:hypothetical protein PEB0150_008380 [Bartonella apis]|uniref:hypothetical protein n=1 Tax=Bartonella apis TaxID=1686310 RepID=UPI000966F6C3|nr:hypothetical protein [Bartonella apis]OLY45853.1 hypothetical protein PEB0150_008380 [Bartonella apis]
MSSNNKYIFDNEIRNKLDLFFIIFFYIFISIIMILPYYFSLNKNNIILFLLIAIFIISFGLHIFIAKFVEKQDRVFYFLFIITMLVFYFISIAFIFFQRIIFILDKNILEEAININSYEKELVYLGILINIFSIVVSVLLLILNKIINTFLFKSSSNNRKVDVDIVSSRFAVNVLTYTTYIGTLFGIIVYGFYYIGGNRTYFFTGVNVTHVAIATVGLVTFFWAAKSAKSKSIELDITRNREAGRLFSDGSLFLSAPHKDKKYVGLFYLNMIAGQSEGPLQKEAIHLMKDFILNANDITTANKQRIRAMEYLSDRLKTDFLDDDIDELIKLSSTELTESNANYRFSQLNVIYENFSFSNDKKYLRYKLLEENKIIKKDEGIWNRLIRKNNSKLTEEDSCKLIAYNNCNFENFSGQNGTEKIILIYANNCLFKNCTIRVVKGYSKKPKTWSNVVQKGEFTPSNNKFEQCDFSDSDGWNILRPSNRMEGEIAETVAENAFINCFYYSGHEPNGFVKERDGALLTEITSKEQFDELIGSSSFMQYAPPTIKTKLCKFLLKLKNEL